MRQKANKCTVELKVQAITCPGVMLPSQEDIYLSVRIMGQYQKSKCVPPVFPLLLHEKMVFVKTFVGMLDPAAVAEHLENDTTSLELIQLVPPEGEILATFEADTREFLYPGPRLTPRSPGPEREILMKRSISFPGISPRVEFSTTSIIEECDVKHGQSAVSSHGRSSAKPSSMRTCLSSAKKKKKSDKVSSCGYEKSTVASRSRAPSPYTHRKMCQLSEEARQRLSHLKLGPYTFQKETAPQAPFVVPRSPNTSLMESSTHLTSQSFTKRSPLDMRLRSYTTELTDPSLLGSFRSKPSQEAARSFPNKSPKDKSTPASGMLLDQSPVLTRSSLRERFQSSSSPSQSQEIHKRVQRILNRHGPRCKLSFDKESEEEEKGVTQSSCVSAHCGSVIDSRLQQDSRSISGEPSAHVESGTFWTNRATANTETSHRAVFEDSLSKIYKELYKNASLNTWTQ
ncbi:spermatogenesis-associated protein 6 isoform 1 [Danio rerio]|uniref:Spermatogenesis-associated protein 6 isoform 1 n=2 Tax=Danio rerio TaxID=7955 RepID=A0AB13AC09_DANRE|nr:spermatogenesis-associated protein 6 isoform X1 [Danio rerio]|eukprot:XP_005166898.1 spermatogenesis-associated protein 6 isoform X1 [Danio rerio]